MVRSTCKASQYTSRYPSSREQSSALRQERNWPTIQASQEASNRQIYYLRPIRLFGSGRFGSKRRTSKVSLILRLVEGGSALCISYLPMVSDNLLSPLSRQPRPAFSGSRKAFYVPLICFVLCIDLSRNSFWAGSKGNKACHRWSFTYDALCGRPQQITGILRRFARLGAGALKQRGIRRSFLCESRAIHRVAVSTEQRIGKSF